MAKTVTTRKKAAGKKRLGPTTDPRDPWNQRFDEFEAYHNTDSHHTRQGRVPESSVFDLGQIVSIMKASHATKMAVYAMKHPNPGVPKDKGLMVAIFFKGSLTNPERIHTPPYLAAETNCPDECATDPIGPPKKAAKQSAKKGTKKAVKKASEQAAKKDTKKASQKK